MEKLKHKKFNTNKQEESKIYKILNFYKLKNTNSSISCHGRPNGKDLKSMKLMYGVNCVLTLQSSKEKPEEIKKLCDENKLKWLHIELQGANLPFLNNIETQKLIVKSLNTLFDILKNNQVVLFIHCAAGLHRTGTIIYSLLRMFEESPQSAMKAIEYIRLETFKEVGENRINYAENLIVPKLTKNISKEEENKLVESIEKIEIKDDK